MGDLSLGDDNWTDESTTLTVASDKGTIDQDFLLWVRPGALDPRYTHIDGIRAEAFAGGIAVKAQAHTFDPSGGDDYPLSGTGVEGSGQTGVHGIGTQTGVVGTAVGGTGVLAIGSVGLQARGDDGPAGTFSSFARSRGALPTPQLHVTPQLMHGLRLPAYADPGDLLMTENDEGAATLWLCVKGGPSQAAVWCEILLGSAIVGTAS